MSKKNMEIRSVPKEVFEEYINRGYNSKEIAKEFGVSLDLIYRVLKGLGLHTNYDLIRDRYAKFNIHKFDIIDTEEKAYWLGMLYSDGCVDTRYWRLCLGLAEKDKEHVFKFKKFLEDTREDSYVRIYNEELNGKHFKSFRYTVHNKYFTNNLIKLGCIPNKSLVLKFPNENIFSRKELIYDFIRGYIDGDGSISTNGRKRHRMRISVLGTLDVLEGIKKYFPQFNKITKRKNIYVMSCSANKADQVGYKLYENATIYLERKRQNYATLCKLHNSETSDKIGESCDANAEVTPEIAKGSESTVENSE